VPGSTRTPVATTAKIVAAIDLARHNSNVIAVVVGNETVYRGEQKVDDLIAD
jgi:exo-beta-1,3-glucanase (GH17 family)